MTKPANLNRFIPAEEEPPIHAMPARSHSIPAALYADASEPLQY